MRETGFLSHGEAGRHLNGGSAGLHEFNGVASCEDAARRDHGDIRVTFVREEFLHFLEDRHEGIVRPVHAKAQVAARERTFHDHIIRHAVMLRRAAKKELQSADRRHHDTDLHVAEAGVIFHEGEGRHMKPRTERNAVDTGIHQGVQTSLQGAEGIVHRELLHAVHKDEAVTLLLFHDRTRVEESRFAQHLA